MSHRASTFGALALGSDLLHDAVLSTVRDVHVAVTRRVRRTVDLIGGHQTDFGRSHGGVSGAVYAGLGAGLRGASAGLRAVDRAGIAPPLEDSPRGQFVVSALNGIFGDRIAERHPELAVTLSLRHDGRDLPPVRSALRRAYPQAGGDLVVFLHGLSESEHYWQRRAAETGGSYGDRLAKEHDWTPLYLRANSGLSLAENAQATSALLERVVAEWPTEVERIALVGHSMGGLILRAACALENDEQTWGERVTDLVTLGTPHLGAPIARALTAGVSALSLIPETAPFGSLLDHRAEGILDLRAGLPRDVRNLPHVRYHVVTATVTASPRHPVGELVGDFLVRHPSAAGRSRRGEELFPDADVLHLPNAHHFDLLNDERVHAALAKWLA